MKKSTSLCGFRLLGLSALIACAALLPARADMGPLPTEAAPAASTGQGTVLKDKVNIRARASRSAEVVAQVHKGDSLAVLERKTVQDGAKSMDWLRVTLPPTAKCFVSTKLIQDGAAASDEVNIRCGPGSNYREVGKLAKGEKVDVIKTHGDWSQITPTEHCSGWIAAEMVDSCGRPDSGACRRRLRPARRTWRRRRLSCRLCRWPRREPRRSSPRTTVMTCTCSTWSRKGSWDRSRMIPAAPASYELRTPEVERPLVSHGLSEHDRDQPGPVRRQACAGLWQPALAKVRSLSGDCHRTHRYYLVVWWYVRHTD